MAEELPLCLLVVPARGYRVLCCVLVESEEHRPMVTSSKLVSHLSDDIPVDVLGAESQIWGGGGAPTPGIEGWGVMW